MTLDEVMEEQPIISEKDFGREMARHGVIDSLDMNECLEFATVADGIRGDLVLQWLGY